MASIKIPPKELSTLKHIVELEEHIFLSLIQALEETSPTLSQKVFIKKIAQSVEGASFQEVESIINTLCALYYLKDIKDLSSEELSEAIDEAAKKSTEEDFSSSDTEAPKRLKTRLKTLLSFDKTLGITAKALDVLTEHDRIFIRSRIVTDIRPVFENTNKHPSAAVIVHHLKISYKQDGEIKEFYVALDTEDIKQLSEVMERTREKTKTLQSTLKETDISQLEVDY